MRSSSHRLNVVRRSYNQGVIPLRVRAELALHAVNGLAYLHEMHVVHFDLKPDNLLLDGPLILGGYGAHPVPTLKVADFGLSKHKWSNYVSGVKDLRCSFSASFVLCEGACGACKIRHASAAVSGLSMMMGACHVRSWVLALS